MTEERRLAASERMKARHAAKREAEAENLLDRENGSEPPVETSVVTVPTLPAAVSPPIVTVLNTNTTDKKLDAILDVLTKLVPMIKIEPPPPTAQISSESTGVEEVLSDLKERLNNPRLKSATFSTEQIFKRIGIVNTQSAVAENRAYFDELNRKLVSFFMSKHGFKQNAEFKWVPNA